MNNPYISYSCDQPEKMAFEGNVTSKGEYSPKKAAI
jgi:hypothetical protein